MSEEDRHNVIRFIRKIGCLTTEEEIQNMIRFRRKDRNFEGRGGKTGLRTEDENRT